MPQKANEQNGKGKQGPYLFLEMALNIYIKKPLVIQQCNYNRFEDVTVVDEQSQAKRCRLSSTPCTPTCLTIREPSNFSNSSSDEDVPIQYATILPTQSVLTSTKAFERGESSKGIISLLKMLSYFLKLVIVMRVSCRAKAHSCHFPS